MILITGAAGFIGSALVWALNRQGRQDLILVDRFGCGLKWKNLLGSRFSHVIDREELFAQLETQPWARQIEAVVHMGACADTTVTDADFLFHNNTEYSRLLCQWALDHKARFIYASSAAVYGDGALGFSDDDVLTPKLRPLNAYGFSKWLFDLWLLEHNLETQVAGLRFFNVFGPNEYHKGKMASIIYRAFPGVLADGVIRLFASHRPDYADGEQLRDFIYVKDVCSVLEYFIAHPHCNGIFNIGSSKPHSFNQLAQAMFAALNREAHIEYFPMPDNIREQYQYFTQANTDKLRASGYAEPWTDFATAVMDYVKHYLAADKYLGS